MSPDKKLTNKNSFSFTSHWWDQTGTFMAQQVFSGEEKDSWRPDWHVNTTDIYAKPSLSWSQQRQQIRFPVCRVYQLFWLWKSGDDVDEVQQRFDLTGRKNKRNQHIDFLSRTAADIVTLCTNNMSLTQMWTKMAALVQFINKKHETASKTNCHKYRDVIFEISSNQGRFLDLGSLGAPSPHHGFTV